MEEEPIYERNVYWAKTGDKKDGPYCTRCYDKERTWIRLTPRPEYPHFLCPECKNTFNLDAKNV